MSWMLKRGNALSRQGDKPRLDINQNPPQPPFKAWGVNTPAEIINGKFRIYDSSGIFAGFTAKGGWSYEFQPQTSYWGVKFTLDFQDGIIFGGWSLSAYIDENWTSGRNPDDLQYKKWLSFGMWTEGSGEDEETYYGVTYNLRENVPLSQIARVAKAEIADIRQPHDWEIRVYADRMLSVWCDGVSVINYWEDDPNYYITPGARGLNFRAANIDADLYDMFYFDIVNPFPSWSTVVYEDLFNTANSATVPGWTKIGTNAGIATQSYATTGTTDGHRAILRALPSAVNSLRVEGIIGGQHSPSSTAAGLVGFSNAAGNSALLARVVDNQVTLRRATSVLSGNPPSFTTIANSSTNFSVSSGNTIALCVARGEIWAEVNGWVICAAPLGTHSSLLTNLYYGAQVARSLFTNSGSWNSVRILTAG